MHKLSNGTIITSAAGKATYTVVEANSSFVVILAKSGKLMMLPTDIIKEYITLVQQGHDINDLREAFTKGLQLSRWDNFTHGQNPIISAIVRFLTKDSLLYDYNHKKTATNATIHQIILQGPPGTGKSHTLNQRATALTDPQNIARITFHPETTHHDFIGTYRPQSKTSTDGSTRIEYTYTPGPLLRHLAKALKAPRTPHILIIEELNRANAASVFADVFQLLDRAPTGESTYAASLGTDASAYLRGELKDTASTALTALLKDDTLKLPSNLHIWATMNTADQGVFPLDTAFKRRWSFDYLGVDDGADVWKEAAWNPALPHCSGVTWQGLRRAINQKLTTANIDEDRQLGPFFLSETELQQEGDELLKAITHKVVAYLRDDVMRYEPERLFALNLPFSQLRSALLAAPQQRKTLLEIFGLESDPVQENLEAFLAAYQQAPGAPEATSSAAPGDD